MGSSATDRDAHDDERMTVHNTLTNLQSVDPWLNLLKAEVA